MSKYEADILTWSETPAGAVGAGWFTRASTEGVTAVTNYVPALQTSGETSTCTFWTKMPTGIIGH